MSWISRDGRGRVTLTDWAPSAPWKVVYKGEVKVYKWSLEQGKIYLREKYNCY